MEDLNLAPFRVVMDQVEARWWNLLIKLTPFFKRFVVSSAGSKISILSRVCSIRSRTHAIPQMASNKLFINLIKIEIRSGRLKLKWFLEILCDNDKRIRFKTGVVHEYAITPYSPYLHYYLKQRCPNEFVQGPLFEFMLPCERPRRHLRRQKPTLKFSQFLSVTQREEPDLATSYQFKISF